MKKINRERKENKMKKSEARNERSNLLEVDNQGLGEKVRFLDQ